MSKGEAPESLVTSPAVWDQRFYAMAQMVAEWSKDPHRRVGAVVVSLDRRRFSVGYNGFPRRLPDRVDWLQDEERRRMMSTHAERNALDNSTFDTTGCAIYVTRFPCLECAKGILNKNLGRLIAPKPDFGHDTWGAQWQMAFAMLTTASVGITYMGE